MPFRTLRALTDKLEWEGGLGEGFHYFGREVNTEDEEFNELWRRAYDSYMELEELISGVREDE